MNPGVLGEMIHELSEGKIVIEQGDYDVELDKLGVDSVLLLSLIVAIEDRYNYEWSEDVDDRVFKSTSTIAEYLTGQLRH